MNDGQEKRLQVGLSGWGDHPQLYDDGARSSDRLPMYSRHFPIVEMDNSFYAIPSPEQMEKWSNAVPNDFGYIVKAYQGMTGHTRGNDRNHYPNAKLMFETFIRSVETLHSAGKLRTVLFQYPPWFQCERKHVEVLKRTREWMRDYPVALEFRHQSWYAPEYRQKTMDLMCTEGWIHSIADEPQAGLGSVPVVLESSMRQAVMVRLHGRNAEGWHSSGQPNWREIRYLYRYSREELEEWKSWINQLLKQSDQCWVIFNNNSGGDAADNAKQLLEMFGLDSGPAPLRQMDWLDEDIFVD
ncbi:DUF72 domain-containing protein [Paenibacillus sp. JCM 10914]|uniref:DUF72 domain-containing protein n=1 Tax=Paenibacillus sp. JCM 10914 TaxID=1236974 RepID=UPI0003CC54EC|nr:DUF72 domain-containing protein [Paenibacillus sp. JCM 10914]GAE04931.1 hypothetical protein JCM10914_1007 [Paenibacillus sp. JCM 10914]